MGHNMQIKTNCHHLLNWHGKTFLKKILTGLSELTTGRLIRVIEKINGDFVEY